MRKKKVRDALQDEWERRLTEAGMPAEVKPENAPTPIVDENELVREAVESGKDRGDSHTERASSLRKQFPGKSARDIERLMKEEGF